MEKNIVKPKTLPGFMELLPNEQILFNQMMDTIKKSYEKEVETPEVKTTTKSLLKEADGAVQKPTGRIVVK